jgi:hypothetical protein
LRDLKIAGKGLRRKRLLIRFRGSTGVWVGSSVGRAVPF